MTISKKVCYFSDVHKLQSKYIKGIATAAVVGFGLGLTACSDSTNTAGGGPSGTEAGNAITAQILTADKTPAAHARVKVIDSESLDAENAYTAETDKSGKVVIEGVPEGHYTLEASLDGKAVQLNVEVTEGNVDLGSSKLGKTAKVSGTVDGKTGVVKVRGMDHSAKVVDGKFDIDSLPAGPISLVFVPEKGDPTSTYLKIVEGSKTQASTFADESSYLLLDDFQDSNFQNRFMPAHTYDGGWWYFSFAEKNVTPVVMSKNGKDTTPALEEEDGNIFAHASVKLEGSYEDDDGVKRWPWANIGVELGMSNKELYCNDISSVESISFKARGSGNIIFTMIDETKEQGSREIMTYEFSPSSDWQTIEVPIKELIFPGYTLKCVNQLLWKLSSPSAPATDDDPHPTIDLQLDDIQLNGGDRLSIWKR